MISIFIFLLVIFVLGFLTVPKGTWYSLRLFVISFKKLLYLCLSTGRHIVITIVGSMFLRLSLWLLSQAMSLRSKVLTHRIGSWIPQGNPNAWRTAPIWSRCRSRLSNKCWNILSTNAENHIHTYTYTSTGKTK